MKRRVKHGATCSCSPGLRRHSTAVGYSSPESRLHGHKRPDVILCDLSMPDGDGFGFIAQVRALPEENGGKVPAIALSGFSGPKVVDRALRAGFDRHVAKPVGLNTLIGAVTELLQ
jgi:CheY-like chemotaxis protein